MKRGLTLLLACLGLILYQAFSILPIYAQTTSSAGQASTTTQQNTPSTTTSPPAPTQSQIFNWINQTSSITSGGSQIDLSVTSQEVPTVSPSLTPITISNPGSNDPTSIAFKLASTENEGALVVDANTWFVFQGYATGGAYQSETPINGLYFIVGTDGSPTFQYGYFLYDPGASVSDLVANRDSSSLNILDNNGNQNWAATDNSSGGDVVKINQSDVQSLLNLVYDVPSSSNNCGSNDSTPVAKTGPTVATSPTVTTNTSTSGGTTPTSTSTSSTATIAGSDVAAIQANPSYTGQVSTDSVWKFNPDCLDTSSTGWLTTWGVNNTNTMGGSDICNFGKLLGELGPAQIGFIVGQIIGCVIDTVLVQAISTMSTVLNSVGGLSYIPESGELDHLALLTSPWS